MLVFEQPTVLVPGKPTPKSPSHGPFHLWAHTCSVFLVCRFPDSTIQPQYLSLQFTSLTPCLSTRQAASMAANTHGGQATCSTFWCPLGPAPRIQLQAQAQLFEATGWHAIYLSDKELELFGQNPRARVEVVLVRKQVLHDSQRSAQGDFTHHLRHAWGEEKP